MKTSLYQSLLTLVVFPFLTVAGLQAADGDKPARPSRDEIIKQFDTNGDGQLDQSERQAVRQHMQATRPGGQGGPGQREGRPGNGHGLARFDTDGDGRLNEAEREAASNAMREHVLNNPRAMQRFDLDGNGALSDDEWAKAREQVADRMGKAGRGGKGPGQGGQGQQRPRSNS